MNFDHFRTRCIGRSRCFRFRVSSLLIVLVIISVWLAVHVNRVRRQRGAVVAIHKVGGKVRYDWQPGLQEHHKRVVQGELAAQAGRPQPRYIDAPRGPMWLRERMGDDYFQEVEEVYLMGHDVTDENVAAIRPLKQLTHLYLNRSRITDRGTRYIEALPNLQHVVLNGTRISDTGLKQLATLDQLQNLYVAGTGITDDGLRVLKALPQLRQLDLDRTRIGDDGVRQITSLANLEFLAFEPHGSE